MPKTNKNATNVAPQETKVSYNKNNVIDIVNNVILTKLEQGVNPWVKGWKTYGKVRVNRPINYVTNKPYTGINTALLDSGYYLSWKQVHELGGKVIDPKNYNIVVFWKRTEYTQSDVSIDEESGEVIEEEITRNGLLLRYYKVYALENTEGCREIKNREKMLTAESRDELYFDNENIEELDNLINTYIESQGIKLRIVEQDSCYYRPSEDSITMPLLKQFNDSKEFYASLFHEMGHSTGVEKRLKRDMSGGFGSKTYAKEELVAEITSAYVMSHCNCWEEEISNNNVAYLQSWVKKLSSELDKKKWLIYQATTQAQKAYELIMGIKTLDELVGGNA